MHTDVSGVEATVLSVTVCLLLTQEPSLNPVLGLAATNPTVLLSLLPLCCGYRSLWLQ